MTVPSGIPTNTTRPMAPLIGAPESEASSSLGQALPQRRVRPRAPPQQQRLLPPRQQRLLLPRLQPRRLPQLLHPLLPRRLISRCQSVLPLLPSRAVEERRLTRSRSHLVAALA